VRIDLDTGLRVADGQPGIVDYFYQEFLPPERGSVDGLFAGEKPPEEVRNQLF
jgi:hypothetical protein